MMTRWAKHRLAAVTIVVFARVASTLLAVGVLSSCERPADSARPPAADAPAPEDGTPDAPHERAPAAAVAAQRDADPPPAPVPPPPSTDDGAPRPERTSTRLAGVVRAEDDGPPLAGARVEAVSEDDDGRVAAVTDAEGRFELAEVPPATYTIRLSRDGWIATGPAVRLTLRDGEVLDTLGLEMRPARSLQGVVIDARDRTPIAGARVRWTLSGFESWRAAYPFESESTSEASGAFTLRVVDDAPGELTVAARGFLRMSRRDWTAPSTAEERVELALEVGGAIEGRVTDTAGEPIAGARVRLLDVGFLDEERAALFESDTTTDAEGHYTLTGVPSVPECTVIVEHDSYAPAGRSGIAVIVGQTTRAGDLILDAGYAIRGRVVGLDGEGISGARVVVTLAACSDIVAQSESPALRIVREEAITDASGGFAVTHLLAGCYGAHANAENMTEDFLRFWVNDERPSDALELVLYRLRVVRGRVVDDRGVALQGARVTSWGAADSVESASREDGSFELGGVSEMRTWIGCSLADHDDALTAVEAAASGDAEIVIRLERMSRIAGFVIGPAGTTLPEIEVEAFGERGGPWAAKLPPRSNGRYELLVPRGTWTVQVAADGFAPSRSEPVTVAPGERRSDIDVVLVEGAVVRGTATVGGEPAVWAEVTLLPATNVWRDYGSGVEADGSFRIEDVPPGPFVLTVKPSREEELGPRFAPARFAASRLSPARAGETVELRLEVNDGRRPAPFDGERRWLTGRVHVAGLPLTGRRVAAIELLRAEARDIDSLLTGDRAVETDAEGRFRVAVASGTHAVVVRDGRGGAAQVVTKIAPDDATPRLDIDLAPLSVSGHVVLYRRPAPEATVVVEAFAADAPRGSTAELRAARRSTVLVGRLGRFTLSNLEPGDYTLRAIGVFSGLESPDGESWIHGVRVGPGSPTSDVEIRLDASEMDSSALVLRARNEAGYPLGMVAALVRDTAGRIIREPEIQLSGDLFEDFNTIRVFGVRPTPAILSLIHPDFAPLRLELAADSVPRRLMVTMRPGGTALLSLADANGAPIEGATVTLLDERGWSLAADVVAWNRYDEFHPLVSRPPLVSGGDGVIRVEHVPPGVHRASATKGDLRSAEVQLTIAEGETAEARLVLR